MGIACNYFWHSVNQFKFNRLKSWKKYINGLNGLVITTTACLESRNDIMRVIFLKLHNAPQTHCRYYTTVTTGQAVLIMTSRSNFYV